jgi:uncharacterized protein with HEPN domain
VKDDKLYLIHIAECLERIKSYIGTGGKTEFMASSLIQDAVLRNLQTLAESTQHLSDSLKAAHPAIPWRQISGFRNILVHNYLGIDLEQVWLIVEQGLPNLQHEVEVMLQALDDEA